MRLCRGWMTCSRARPGEDPWGCSHAHLHAGSDTCFTPCSNGDHTICMEVRDANLPKLDDMRISQGPDT